MLARTHRVLNHLVRFDSLLESSVPTLTRLLLVLLLLGGLGYGAIYALANFVEPGEREITVRVKKDGFGR